MKVKLLSASQMRLWAWVG